MSGTFSYFLGDGKRARGIFKVRAGQVRVLISEIAASACGLLEMTFRMVWFVWCIMSRCPPSLKPRRAGLGG